MAVDMFLKLDPIKGESADQKHKNEIDVLSWSWGLNQTGSQHHSAGGGAGKVWANTSSKIYHCQGDRYYGTTKQGEYMTVADAKAKGIQPAKGSKACNS